MPAKNKTISMRISESDKQALNRAANMKGTNLTSFVLQSAMTEAHETLKNEKRIELTKRDMKKLLEIMDSTVADENLAETFAHYNEAIH